MNIKHLAFLPIPVLIILIFFLDFVVGPSVFYDPPWLVLVLNAIFITAISFTVSVISVHNYAAAGRVQVLLLGCGVLVLGIGGGISAFTIRLPDGANISVTIHNTGVFIAALFHFIAALVLISALSESRLKQKSLWFTGYIGVIIFMALITTASIKGLIPVFFIQGEGPTILRQVILGSAAVLFAFSFLIFLITYKKNKEAFTYWYSLALGLNSICLIAVFTQNSVGSPVGWAGRAAQYTGGIYFFIAILKAIKSAAERKTSLDSVITASLSSAEENFRLLAENIPDIIVRFNSELKYVYINQAGIRLSGKTRHSIIGRTMEEIGVPEPYCTTWRKRIQKGFDTGETSDGKEYFHAPDGMRYLQYRYIPEFEAGNSVTSVLVIGHDLTEYKKAGEALRESEEHLRLALEAARAGMWIWDLHESWQTTPQTSALFGRSSDGPRIHFEEFASLIHPEDRERVAQGWNRTIRSGEPYDQEYRILWPDGSIHWLSSRGALVELQSGVRQFTGITVDITERKQAEEHLAFQAYLLANISDVVYSTDNQLHITSWNHAAEKIYGWKKEEVLGKNIIKVTGSTFDPELRARLNAELQKKETVISEIEHTTRSGEHVIFESRTMLLRDTGGKAAGFVAVNRDITDRKRAGEALLLAREELEQIVQARTAELKQRTQQLRTIALELTKTENRERKRLAVILHDNLQQILVGAKLGNEAIQKQIADNELKMSVRKIAELLDESIKVSRSLTSELSPPILHEGGLVPGLQWLSRWFEEKQGFVVNIIAKADVPPDTEGISILLFQSVRELLFNVIKHAEVREALVLINTSDDMLYIIIEDKGKGFNVEQLKNPGFEAGYGLFSVRERIDFLGGKMNIDSAPGMGTRATIITPLPGKPAQEKTAADKNTDTLAMEAATAGAPVGERKIRVLIADDHAVVREGFVQLIGNEADMEVVGEASNGEEALDLARKLRPDVIIMDISMPKMNGIEATEKITGEISGIRIIGLSMYEKEDMAEAIIEAGASKFLTKDGPSKDLIAAIRGKRR